MRGHPELNSFPRIKAFQFHHQSVVSDYKGNWEVPVPLFVVFKLSQRRGAEEAM